MKTPEQQFTSRELQIIELISEGLLEKEIATQSALSLNTFCTHRINILRQSENA